MTYATQQNLIDRFGATELIQLTDRATPPAGAIDATVVGTALIDADAEINGYLKARYSLPLSPVPLVLNRLACDVARYYLYEDRVTEQVRRRYEDAVKILQNISRGLMEIGVDAANQAPAAEGGTQHEATDRVFTKGSLSKGTAGTLDDY